MVDAEAIQVFPAVIKIVGIIEGRRVLWWLARIAY
jgi:hypothetical protein